MRGQVIGYMHNKFDKYNKEFALLSRSQAESNYEKFSHLKQIVITVEVEWELAVSATRMSNYEEMAIQLGLPRKHKTFVKHLYNVGTTSSTLVQHCINILCLLGIDTFQYIYYPSVTPQGIQV